MCSHGPDDSLKRPNAQGKRRRSTEGAQGTNTGHENAEGMACVGVRLTDQLGDAVLRMLLASCLAWLPIKEARAHDAHLVCSELACDPEAIGRGVG